MMWSDRTFPQDSQFLSAELASAKERQPHQPLFYLFPAHLTKRELDFIDEPLLPVQFLVPSRESLKMWSGARRLLFGVLEEAVRSFAQYQGDRTSRGKQLFRETCEWFWSTDRQWLYSFENICEHLHLDPDYLRQGLQRWQHALEGTKSSNGTRPSVEATPTVKTYFRLGSGLRSRNFPGAGSVISPAKMRETKRP
jgi:hypothetical protein